MSYLLSYGRPLSPMPFGAMLFRNVYNGGTWVSAYKFTGQEHDSEFELYNYNARLYDPVMGRFISPDSLVQAPYNPQSLNRYSYCLNNPLIYIDPTGYYWWNDLWNSFTNWFQDTFTQTVTVDPTITENSDGSFTLGELTVTAEKSKISVFAYSTTENIAGTMPSGSNIVRMPINQPGKIIRQPIQKQTADLISETEKYLGAPYYSGGASKEGMDCTHLIWIGYKALAVTYKYSDTSALPNNKNLKQVTGPQKNDIVLFANNLGEKGHAGIYNPNPPSGFGSDCIK